MAFQTYQSNQGTESLDSITLGQLKAMVGSAPKPKQSFYDFRYDDEDKVLNEIEEFYSYVEMPQVAENWRAWQGSYNGDWTRCSFAQRKAHVEVLLESLEHRDAVIRFTNARRLLYILQGTFAETLSQEHQLHWIVENCKVVRAANGINTIVEAMKIATLKHDLLCGLTDADATHLRISPTERTEFIEEITTEISVYLGMLYHMVEVFKAYDDFADELMSLDPPMPVYLFNVVALMKDKTAKGYPIKKLLLLTWKTLLCCCGGIRELARAKKLARELSNLPPLPEEAMPIKSSPIDIETFRQETAVKYPTFTAPPPQPVVPDSLPTLGAALGQAQIPARVLPATSRLAQAYSPIPIRHHYHHDTNVDNSAHPGLPHPPNPHGNPFQHQQQQQYQQPQYPQQPQQQQQQQQQQHSQFRPTAQPLTPAPTPPPSPKPKKQQYQTDQSRPFLFPFSKAQSQPLGLPRAGLVPFAIEEADKLYNKHMYVSLALAQMWRTREECMMAESGLDFMPGAEAEAVKIADVAESNNAETTEPLADVALLDTKIAEAAEAMKQSETSSERRKAKERREDLMRLKRVEQIYSAVLPMLSSWVLVLLKLLLAVVSASSNNQIPQSTTSSVFPLGGVSPAQEHPPAPLPTLEEIDITRHREVTSKAVSAILLLVLKWFKVSHVMKFHHLGQLLLDTNCLLLILKMFGLQEVYISVVSKADSPDNNFFRYCQANFARNQQNYRPEDQMPYPPRKTVLQKTTLPNGQIHEEEVEMLTDFSWRNFFSTINFAKIMQKLSKHRSHRIWMLVTYKSSAVLKRMLRVSHPMLQLHVLKLIKSQVPFCGRKWRQSNMKVITSIYLNCRPDLRDEWLTGTEIDGVPDAQAQEQALRHLVKFYNNKRYGPAAAPQHGNPHRRSVSMSNHLEGLHPGPELSNLMRPLGTPNVVDADVFPPSRSQAPDPSIFLPFMTEDIAFEEEYEDYLSDLGWSDDASHDNRPLFGGTSSSAWDRLPSFANDIADAISDSESVVSLGDLGEDARLDGADAIDENLNNWEHMSPKTMAALPKSPAGARRSSAGTSLRPVLPFGLDDGSAIDLDDEDEPELGPIPREQSGPFASGASVDEVEYAYGV